MQGVRSHARCARSLRASVRVQGRGMCARRAFTGDKSTCKAGVGCRGAQVCCPQLGRQCHRHGPIGVQGGGRCNTRGNKEYEGMRGRGTPGSPRPGAGKVPEHCQWREDCFISMIISQCLGLSGSWLAAPPLRSCSMYLTPQLFSEENTRLSSYVFPFPVFVFASKSPHHPVW